MADAGLNVKVTINRDFVKDTVKLVQLPATQAALTAANRIKILGRQNIRSSYDNMGGLANAFRVDVYPDKFRGYFPKIFARVRTGYSNVFEEGAVIRGKPYLWIPLPAARKMMGRKRMTPAMFNRKFGYYSEGGKKKSNRLFLLKDSEKPVLAGLYATGQRRITKYGRQGWEGRRSIKRFTKNSRQFEIQPLFVGIRMSKITPQWRLRAIVLAESAKLPEQIRRAVSYGAQ